MQFFSFWSPYGSINPIYSKSLPKRNHLSPLLPPQQTLYVLLIFPNTSSAYALPVSSQTTITHPQRNLCALRIYTTTGRPLRVWDPFSCMDHVRSWVLRSRRLNSPKHTLVRTIYHLTTRPLMPSDSPLALEASPLNCWKFGQLPDKRATIYTPITFSRASELS